METSDISPGSIVVGVDGSRSSNRAVKWAVRQARIERRPVTLVHAVGVQAVMYVNSLGGLDAVPYDLAMRAGEDCLVLSRAIAVDTWAEVEVSILFRHCDPRDALAAAGSDAAMIVVGSRGRGTLATLLMGSVSVSIARDIPCPVVVVRPSQVIRNAGPVLVGVDSNGLSGAAVEFAFRQASLRTLPLVVAHCFWTQDARRRPRDVGPGESGHEAQHRIVLDAIGAMQVKYPQVQVTTRLAVGLPDTYLVRESATASLAVVGTHPGSLLADSLWREVSLMMVEHAHCAVAVVPEPVGAQALARRAELTPYV